MNTSYYADINSILNTFHLDKEEADRIINSFEDYESEDYDELEDENEEEEDFFIDR